MGKTAKMTKSAESSKVARPGSPMADAEFSAKKKSKKKAKEPVVEVDSDDDDEASNAEAAATEEKIKGEALSFAIRRAAKEICAETGNKRASDEEVADVLKITAQQVKSSRHSLRLIRQGARLSGIRKAALKAGYSRRQNTSRFEARGLDIEQSLLTSADIQRMARSIPLNFDKGSYSPEENAMRLDLINDKLPIGAAREITAFVEPFFRSVMNECVERQARLKTSRISPSTMYSTLKKYADLGVFTALVPPKGLVRFGKEEGVGVDYPRAKEPKELMAATDEDKKAWKLEKKANKAAAENLEEMVQAQVAEKAERKKKKAGEAGESAVASAAEKKTKKKKREGATEDAEAVGEGGEGASSSNKKSKKSA